MLEALEVCVKLAVDIDRKVVAGGGALHSDCEEVLLRDGSRQQDIWGATWLPFAEEVRCSAIINIRPRQNNPAMIILDLSIRARVEQIVRQLVEGV